MLQRLEGTYAMNQKMMSPSLWHDLIPPCQAKARSQKKHAKARKAPQGRTAGEHAPRGQLHVGCAVPLICAEIGFCWYLSGSVSPNSCEASFCLEGQKEAGVGPWARPPEETGGLRQKKGPTGWVQTGAEGHEHCKHYHIKRYVSDDQEHRPWTNAPPISCGVSKKSRIWFQRRSSSTQTLRSIDTGRGRQQQCQEVGQVRRRHVRGNGSSRSSSRTLEGVLSRSEPRHTAPSRRWRSSGSLSIESDLQCLSAEPTVWSGKHGQRSSSTRNPFGSRLFRFKSVATKAFNKASSQYCLGKTAVGWMYTNPVNNVRFTYHINWLAGFLNHQQYEHQGWPLVHLDGCFYDRLAGFNWKISDINHLLIRCILYCIYKYDWHKPLFCIYDSSPLKKRHLPEIFAKKVFLGLESLNHSEKSPRQFCFCRTFWCFVQWDFPGPPSNGTLNH